MREKNLKQRIDLYKKELQKRDVELNNLISNNNNNISIFKTEIINQLKQLQNERSKMINRRDLKNQIKERDEQIAFLINHFSKQSNVNEQSQIYQNNDSFYNSSQQALSQIEANLTSVMAPFQINNKSKKKNKKQNKKMENINDAYHFIPATSSSDNSGEISMLNSIFGDSYDMIKQKQPRIKYDRDTISSKQKRKNKKKKKSKHKQFHYDKSDDDDDDDDNVNDDNHSNFILDDHEDRYKSFDRKYG